MAISIFKIKLLKKNNNFKITSCSTSGSVPPVQKHCFRIPQILSVSLFQDNTCYLFTVTEAFILYDNLRKTWWFAYTVSEGQLANNTNKTLRVMQN